MAYQETKMDRFEAYGLAYEIRGAALGIPLELPPTSPVVMCELISAYFASRGIVMSPEQIWNYSPTGELFKVFEWHRMARHWQQLARALPPPR
jgi:hypothetical protein